MTDIDKREARGLETLVDKINAEHRAFTGSLKKTAEHGIRAGKLLVDAKSKCKHGTWLDWLEAHFEGAPRTAQEYMRLYGRRDEVRANTRDSAHLSIAGALKEIAAPKKPVEATLTPEPTEGTLTREAPGDTVRLQPSRSPERRMAVEALAEAKNLDPDTARKDYRHEVDQIRIAIEHESEKREEKGKPFPAEEREDYAKKIAEWKERTRAREKREREEQRKKHTFMFMDIDADLSQARRKVRDAFGKFHEDIEFTDDEVELLYREAAAAREMLGLFCAALTGDSGTDWDAALAELEYRRQYGPDGIEGDANS